MRTDGAIIRGRSSIAFCNFKPLMISAAIFFNIIYMMMMPELHRGSNKGIDSE